MKHIFKQGLEQHPTLVLLHGTGGNEHDLLSIGEIIDPNASLLGIKGNILENGMPRFFKRLAEGLFDEEDLRFRTEELHDFIEEAAQTYGFDKNNVLLLGYSNGANIAGSLLLNYGNIYQGAALLHPMVPMRQASYPSLNQTPIFISAGRNDPICAMPETDELIEILEEAGSTVSSFWHDFGHRLTAEEVAATKQWYQQTFN
ncbi:alpha/beta hydrolase [Brochothrix thermosphacta]|uniref:alpha/beta hydrolase n=1 Tax=Brochothrix thermosphacta TaxID=2756 RepID=UPI0003E8BF28|nr:alpha/beta hydrolase [Brochothrix thermosphacta]EUJ37313.1 carboxylesterase [Brochothrix thermosphacta DSM 20171 = FSL F6-1036]ODJ49123.1 carboxylesterase [Brochothrix thermosphacta DSM 20171 = FSL F6-1036]